jgi:hypothetical protein
MSNGRVFVSDNDYLDGLGWETRRIKIFYRDHGMCRYCLAKLSLCDNNTVHIDHVVPKSLMGTDDLKNLVTSCRACNLKKGQRTPEQAGMFLYEVPIIFTNAEYVHMKYSPDKSGSRIGQRPKRLST